MDLLKLNQLVFHPWVAQTPRNVPGFVGGADLLVEDYDVDAAPLELA